jgi:hypothetical protein
MKSYLHLIWHNPSMTKYASGISTRLETGVLRENHHPFASHIMLYLVHLTIQTHYFSGDKHWLIWNLTCTWSDTIRPWQNMHRNAPGVKFLISRILLMGIVTRLGWRYRVVISTDCIGSCKYYICTICRYGHDHNVVLRLIKFVVIFLSIISPL